METREIKTPSGHRVILRTKLTFGQARNLEKIWVKNLKVDPVTKKATFDATSVYDAQDEAAKYLIEKIITKDGKESTDSAVIFNWSEEDGRLVYEEIEKITSKYRLTPESKKK